MGEVATFLASPEEEMLRDLKRFTEPSEAPHLFAWDRSLSALRRELSGCMPRAAGFRPVPEYEPPRSRGRRPDLILLENGTVLDVDFRNRASPPVCPCFAGLSFGIAQPYPHPDIRSHRNDRGTLRAGGSPRRSSFRFGCPHSNVPDRKPSQAE